VKTTEARCASQPGLPPPRARSVLALSVATLLLSAAAASAVVAGPPRLLSITVEPANVSLIPGRTQAMQAFGVYSDGSRQDLTSVVTFRSREPKVATVDAAGLVTAVGAGRSEISAADPTSGLVSRITARVTVYKLKSIAVSPGTITVRVGGQISVRALGTYEDGTKDVDLTGSVEWSSGKTSVATVAGDSKGVVSVSGVSDGQTKIIAAHRATGIKSSSSTGLVNVVRRLARVAVSPARKALRRDERTHFKATGTFEKGAEVEISADVTWSTGDPAVGTADGEGRVRAVGLGSTTVRATDRATGITSTAAAADGVLNVVGDVIALRVTPVDVILPIGGTKGLKASASFAEQREAITVTTKVDWLSSDPEAVAVERTGVVTCLAPGTVLVSAQDPLTGVTSTATGGDARVLCGLTMRGVEVVPDAVFLGLGKTKKLKAFFVFEEGSRVEVTKQVEWRSSDRRIVTVDVAEPNIGRVKAVADGAVAVDARDPATGRSSADADGVSCTVIVQGQPISIQIEPDPTGRGTLNVAAGETLKLKVLARFVGGATKGIDSLVTWTSSAPDIVRVSNGDDGDRPGFAHFGPPGTAVVTIAYPKVGTPLPPGASHLTDSLTITVR
jgi:trimeric autotransporter adhesin